MPVPERIPLPAPDDRIQRVVLQQQHAARGDPGDPLGQRGGLIRRVHQPETVEHHVGRIAVRHRREPAVGQQAPATSRRAGCRTPPPGRRRPADRPRRPAPRRRRPGRRGRPARLPAVPRAPSGRPPAEPGRTMSTATSARGTPDRARGRRTAGSSRRPAARPGRAPADRPARAHARHTGPPMSSLPSGQAGACIKPASSVIFWYVHDSRADRRELRQRHGASGGLAATPKSYRANL